MLFTVEEKDLSIYFVAVKGLIKVNPKFFTWKARVKFIIYKRDIATYQQLFTGRERVIIPFHSQENF